MTFRVDYSPKAKAQLLDLYRYIADAGSPSGADSFVTSIVDYCSNLSTMPQRGTRRDDIRPGLRIVGFRRRVAVAFIIDTEIITILGVFYGGQDWETDLQE